MPATSLRWRATPTLRGWPCQCADLESAEDAQIETLGTAEAQARDFSQDRLIRTSRSGCVPFSYGLVPVLERVCLGVA